MPRRTFDTAVSSVGVLLSLAPVLAGVGPRVSLEEQVLASHVLAA
jgi:hypothetical protein